MQLTNLFDENDGRRAVSPVIGVILMVAITVILAAVIGTFVLGLGGQVEETPQASLSFDGDTSGVTVEHRGGDSFNHTNIEIRGSANGSITGTDDPFRGSGTFETGDVEEIGSSSSLNEGTLTLVYVGGEREAIIGSYEVE